MNFSDNKSTMLSIAFVVLMFMLKTSYALSLSTSINKVDNAYIDYPKLFEM